MEKLDDSYLYFKCLQGLAIRKVDTEEYRERLYEELGVITKMGFSGYFLIVADFISWAKSQKIPVGPARGSAAGSLVTYLMEITDVDPIRWGLQFARFLNPYRVSMPDIDSDVSQRHRARVVDYLAQKYGRDRVCSIGTTGTYKAKSSIKDTCRTLRIDHGIASQYASLIPDGIRGGAGEYKVTLGLLLNPTDDFVQNYSKELNEFQKAYDINPQFKRVIDLALAVESLPKSEGVHAAGVIIGDSSLHNELPLRRKSGKELESDGDDLLVSQWTDKQVESMGYVKFDVLGLRNLDVIADAVDSIEARTGIVINWDEISLEDPLTYELISSGETYGVFQFEESGMAGFCKGFKPKNLSDLSMISALYRPGPMDNGMVTDALNIRKGGTPHRYPIEKMNEVLESTYGLFVFQEQVLSLAKELAGYDLGEADLLRRAIGKKNQAEMDANRERFISGGIAKGHSQKDISDVFEMINKHSNYGFNASHSLSYAITSFRTAYLKTHYPSDFFSAVLTSYDGKLDKIPKGIAKAKLTGIDVLSPDVNRSKAAFYPTDGNSISYALSGIKGCGFSSIEHIVSLAEKKPFVDLMDFIERVLLGKVKKNNIQALSLAGAFDSLEPKLNRKEIAAYALDLITHFSRRKADAIKGQQDLFDLLAPIQEQVRVSSFDYLDLEYLADERLHLGFNLTKSPFGRYQIIFDKYDLAYISELEEAGKEAIVLAKVLEVNVRQNGYGSFAFVKIQDDTGEMSLKVWSKEYQKYGHLLIVGNYILVCGKTSEYRGIEIQASSILNPDLEIDRLFDRIVLSKLDFERLVYISKLPIGLVPIDYEPTGADMRFRLGTFEVTYASFPFKEE
jgi:DNA polymerase-3 subunit alpha